MPETDPDKYSIDQMMDRLKDRPEPSREEEGQMVTRADGSTAIRVRKRKRRSRQPHKEEQSKNRRKRMWQFGAVAMGLLAIVSVIAGAFIFTNSSAFREKSLERIEAATGAEVTAREVRMTPFNAEASGMALRWPESSPLDELQLGGVHASLNPFKLFTSSLNGRSAGARQGYLRLRNPTTSSNPVLGDESANPPVDFSQYRIGRLDVDFGSAKVRAQASGLEAMFYPRKDQRGSLVQFSRGMLTIPEWPELRIERGFIDFTGRNARIETLRLLDKEDNRGIASVHGTFDPLVGTGSEVLAIHFEQFVWSALLGIEGAKILNGRFDSQMIPDGDPLRFANGGIEFDAAIRCEASSRWELAGLPAFSQIAKLLDDTWFERPFFVQDANARVSREAGAVRVHEINLEQRAKIVIKGEMRFGTDGALGGTLDLGFPENLIGTRLTEDRASFLSAAKGGYRWVAITISGTIAEPEDDFREIFNRSREQALTPAPLRDPGTENQPGDRGPATPATPAADPGDLFEELTNPR